MAKLEHFGRDKLSDREMYLIDASRPEDVPIDIPVCGGSFVCLLAWDASHVADDAVKALAYRLLNAGCVYICCWGPGSSRVEDLFDEVDVERSPNGPIVMSTWHEHEPLAEALWFALFNAFPDAGHSDVCQSVLGLSVGSSAWAATIRSAMVSPKGFNGQIQKSD